MHGLKLAIYYLLVARLPNSRFSRALSKLRTGYAARILGILEPDPASYFEEHVYIGDAGRVKIGRSCMINENVFIQGATIGDHVMIAPNCAILSRSHHFERTDIPMMLQGDTQDRVPVIEDDVWIGRNTIILPGVRIGRGSIVAAGAVVTADVEPWSIVAGVPARLLRKRVPAVHAAVAPRATPDSQANGS